MAVMAGSGTTAPAFERVGERAPVDLTARLGFWSAVLATAASVGFPVGLVVSALAVPQAAWHGDISRFAAGYRPGAMLLTVVPSVLIVPGFLGVVVAFHSLADMRSRSLTTLALVAAALYAATVGVNYFLELSAVRTNLADGTNLRAVAPWVMSDTGGFFWALEILGYGWQGVAGALLATTFAGAGVERWLRRLFAAFGIAGVWPPVLVGAGLALTSPAVIVAAPVWMVGFPAAMSVAAVHFHRLTRDGRRAHRASAGPMSTNASTSGQSLSSAML